MRRRTVAANKRDQELREQTYQLKQWRAWHRVLAQEALAHPQHGALVRETFEILRTMKDLHDRRVLDLVARTDWSAVDYNVKATLLREIDRRIVALREAAGLPCFDDALPHEERLNGFLIIRDAMMGTTPGDPGEKKGEDR
jgi:hypothetical protein